MAAIYWLQALLGMFLVTLIWIATTPVIEGVYEPIYNMTNDTNARATMSNLMMIWSLWPWIFVFGFIFYAIVASQKREYDTGYR